MATFTLKLSLDWDEAPFLEAEIARALRNVAERVSAGERKGEILDMNDYEIGEFKAEGIRKNAKRRSRRGSSRR